MHLPGMEATSFGWHVKNQTLLIHHSWSHTSSPPPLPPSQPPTSHPMLLAFLSPLPFEAWQGHPAFPSASPLLPVTGRLLAKMWTHPPSHILLYFYLIPSDCKLDAVFWLKSCLGPAGLFCLLNPLSGCPVCLPSLFIFKIKMNSLKYTNTAYDEVPKRPNMWYIFEKRIVQGYQKLYTGLSVSRFGIFLAVFQFCPNLTQKSESRKRSGHSQPKFWVGLKSLRYSQDFRLGEP